MSGLEASMKLPEALAEHAGFVGGGDYLTIAHEFLEYFISLGGLRPFDRVLDVGCGFGRMVYGLTKYIDDRGSYEGFDAAKNLIDWAIKNLVPHLPKYRFQHTDIRNQAYNPTGKIHPQDFVFPYVDREFDFVFLSSVFTHMFIDDIKNYVEEIYRVMKPGGRLLLTAFLLNSETESLIKAGKSTLAFDWCEFAGCYTPYPHLPEAAIGIPAPVMSSILSTRGFKIRTEHPGSWCGRTEFTSYQDIVVAWK